MKRKLIASLIAVTALVSSSVLAALNPRIVKVDLDIEVVADASEFTPGPGGFVAKGGWKMITLSVDGAGSARLNWNSTNIVVYTATNGTALANPTYWPDTSTMPSNLWVYGVDVSATGPTATTCGPEHLCLEALNNGTSYTTPYFDRVGFTVVNVEKIEYCRFDLSTWVTDLTIAAGAKASDVHKAKVRITMKPVFAGLAVTASTNGTVTYGTNVLKVGVLTPTTSQNTDASGQVTCEYRSGDKDGVDLAIIVTEVAGDTVSIDPGSTLRQKWDIAGDYDWRAPLDFYPEEADDVRFYPTLEASGGAGAIDGHSMEHYTPQIEILVVQYDLTAGTVVPDTVIGEYPDYWYVSPPACMPSGFVVTDFVEITSPTEEYPGGIYRSTHKVHDWWDYNFSTGILTDLFVTKYELGACDKDVYSTTPFP